MAETATVTGFLELNDVIARLRGDDGVTWAIEDPTLLDRLLGEAPVWAGGPFLYCDRVTLTVERDAANGVIARVLMAVIHGEDRDYRV